MRVNKYVIPICPAICCVLATIAQQSTIGKKPFCNTRKRNDALATLSYIFLCAKPAVGCYVTNTCVWHPPNHT